MIARTAIERRLKHAGYEVAIYASAQLADRLPAKVSRPYSSTREYRE
jgi:hypothetical protein